MGKEHLLEPNALIMRMLNKRVVFNLIFYGPPGIGKSTLVRVLATDLNFTYSYFNPVINSKQDLLQIVNQAKLTKPYLVIID